MVVTLQTVKNDMVGSLKSEDVLPSNNGLTPNNIATGELSLSILSCITFLRNNVDYAIFETR